MTRQNRKTGTVRTAPHGNLRQIKIASPLGYYIHVDADRDGIVDDSIHGLERWGWGKNNKGAIIRVNNDRDGVPPGQADNSDDQINGAADLPDIAVLEIRRHGRASPVDWTGRIRVSPTLVDYVRIFDSRSDSAKEVIGPNGADEYSVGVLNFDKKELGIEAVLYPDETFDGLVPITWEVFNGSDVILAQQIVVRVAPWIVFNHSHPTRKVYVAITHARNDNTLFRALLNTELTRAGIPAAEEVDARGAGEDRWMQDVMEIGFSTLPYDLAKSNWSIPVVLRTARDRSSYHAPTQDYPRNHMLGPDFGFTQTTNPDPDLESLDSFGNLECSPPVQVQSGKRYEFGRIVYGTDPNPKRDLSRSVKGFLAAQNIQNPIELDTSWLLVGHVDEVFSFCPEPTASQGFRVLIASPRRAMSILTRLHASGEGGAPLFDGFDPGSEYPLRTVDAILYDNNIMDDQQWVQEKIDRMKNTLMTELNLQSKDFIELPMLFISNYYVPPGVGSSGGVRWAIAYTPGVVNMLVLTKADKSVHLVIPKPFGPVVSGICQFEHDIEQQLVAYSNHVSYGFIDDFSEYHVLAGEIHCGTNSLRDIPQDIFWWEQLP